MQRMDPGVDPSLGFRCTADFWGAALSSLRSSESRIYDVRAWPTLYAPAIARRGTQIPCYRNRQRHFHRLRAPRSRSGDSPSALHILPGDPGFGSPLLGLYLYTWSLIAFISQIAASGLTLISVAWIEEEQVRPRMTNVTAIAFLVIVVANLVSVIPEAGFNWELPSDPVGYLLFK